MTNREFFLQCRSTDIPLFVRVFNAVPADKLDWRPEPKARTARENDDRWQRGQADGRHTGLLQQFLAGPRNEHRQHQANVADRGSAEREASSLVSEWAAEG